MRRSGDTISTIVEALAAVVLPPGAPAGRQPAAKAGEPASPREPTTDPADKRQTEIRLEDIVDDLEPIGNRQPRARFNNDRGVCGPQGGAKAQEDIEQQGARPLIDCSTAKVENSTDHLDIMVWSPRGR
ncbi:MAG: hypothetical protein ACE5KM_16865 [Planctomycetaceae bacterium]